ncbi:hypothetical protein HPB47_028102 [Ixodes persulcatus]|uniref:Uncharacterized protein n=1 Tax=Ixodes persulcatus TaxID=34615 RepID=A0AC60PVD3_IXOPE|nr:hypothetical protein HPB47_028102 [Ixodes persulcatus]
MDKAAPSRSDQANSNTTRTGALTQFLATQEHQPDATALQEAGGVPSLSGYITFCQETTSEEEKPGVSTLVSKHIPVIEHSLETSIPYVFLELLPQKRGHCSLFLLNVYSSPSKSKDTFNHLFRDALRIACPKDNNILIVGEFIATHTTLGYAKASAKGRKLMDTIDVYRFTLLNEPDQPTRIGNSISRDTCRDLTLARTRDSCICTNLGESLGSNNLILETEVPVQLNQKRGKRQRLVNRNSFRQLRSAAAKGNPIGGDERALERWVQQIQEDVERATKTILTTDKASAVDPHLLHLWEARRSLTKRWRREKYNRKLRTRIAKLTQEAEQYAEECIQTNWHKLCDRLQGTLGTKQTWSLLRSLLDPTKTKVESSKALNKCLHSLPREEGDRLWETLSERYIAAGPRPEYPSYPYNEGDNPHPLDADITEQEVRNALQNITRNTAPGKDGVTYRLLRT